MILWDKKLRWHTEDLVELVKYIFQHTRVAGHGPLRMEMTLHRAGSKRWLWLRTS